MGGRSKLSESLPEFPCMSEALTLTEYEPWGALSAANFHSHLKSFFFDTVVG